MNKGRVEKRRKKMKKKNRGRRTKRIKEGEERKDENQKFNDGKIRKESGSREARPKYV